MLVTSPSRLWNTSFVRWVSASGHIYRKSSDLSVIEELQPLDEKLKQLRGVLAPEKRAPEDSQAGSASDNLTVASQALRELKSFMMHDQKRLHPPDNVGRLV